MEMYSNNNTNYDDDDKHKNVYIQFQTNEEECRATLKIVLCMLREKIA